LSADKIELFDLKEEKRYWELKEGAIDHTIWRSGFGRRKTREKCKKYVERRA